MGTPARNAAASSLSTSQKIGAAARKTGFLIESIASDLHLCALETGVVTMILGASLSGSQEDSSQSCSRLLLDDSSTMLLALRYGSDIGVSAEMSAMIGRLYTQILEEKRRLAPLTRAGAISSGRYEGLRERHASWRRVAREAAHVVKAFHTAHGRALNSVYAEDALAVEKFLIAASEGAAGLMDEAGKSRLPRFKQRRKDARAPIQQNCTLILSRGEFPARLEDVSRNGLGLTCAEAQDGDKDVVVLLQDGRRIAATIARRNGARIGLSLQSPLSGLDPLFTAA